MTSRLPRRRCCCWSARLFVTSIKVDARQSMWLERVVVVVVEAPAAEAEIAWFLHSKSTSAYRPPTSIFLALLPSSWFRKSRIINSTNLKKKERILWCHSLEFKSQSKSIFYLSTSFWVHNRGDWAWPILPYTSAGIEPGSPDLWFSISRCHVQMH